MHVDFDPDCVIRMSIAIHKTAGNSDTYLNPALSFVQCQLGKEIHFFVLTQSYRTPIIVVVLNVVCHFKSNINPQMFNNNKKYTLRIPVNNCTKVKCKHSRPTSRAINTNDTLRRPATFLSNYRGWVYDS